ncbi:hypothetical protein KTGMC3_P0100 [Methanocalculus sp. MC3]
MKTGDPSSPNKYFGMYLMSESIDKPFNADGAKKMDSIAKGPFAPIYPIIADQIMDVCKITSGSCIDLGCGPAHLAIAVARVSDLAIDAVDSSPDMLTIATENIKEAGLSGCVRVVNGDVHALPYEDSSVDIIISRGSLFFWNDLNKAFLEIYRVLRPNGRTFIGGGFGTDALKEEIFRKMRSIDPKWEKNAEKRLKMQQSDKIPKALEAAGVADYEIRRDLAGFWIIMRK